MTEATPTFEQECFFIAPIGAPDSQERTRSDGILKFIIARAAEELGLQALRADAIAEPGQITLQVIDHVLNARAAVADLTGRNPNVYYELAIRHTAKLPVVLIADVNERLPFDIAQMRTIFFDHRDLNSADNCREQIVAQLQSSFDGSVDSPIATTVDIRALQGGSAMERNVAELVRSVEGINAELLRLRAESQAALARVGATPVPKDPKRRLAAQLQGLEAVARKKKNQEVLTRVRNMQQTVDQLAEIDVALGSYSPTEPVVESDIQRVLELLRRRSSEPLSNDDGPTGEEPDAPAQDQGVPGEQ